MEIPYGDVTFMKHIYHQNAGVETLILERCSGEAVCDALGSLIPGWPGGEGSVNGRNYLTKLKMLEVRGYVAPHHWELFGDIVAELLIGRPSSELRPTLCINLILGKLKDMKWATGTKEYLQEFSRSGSGVRLLEDGEQVDWS